MDSTNNNSDRRRFFRVRDSIALKYRLVAPGELEGLIKRLEQQKETSLSLPGTFAATSKEMEYLLRKIMETQPELSTYLENLNHKLDLIARSMFMENSDLATTPPCEVDLSASGVAFHSDVYFKPGANVEIKLLTFPSLTHITAIGVVIRSVRDLKSQGLPYDVAVDFDFIRDHDRELLIQHVLQKEVSELREKRQG